MNVLRQCGFLATVAGALLFSCATSQSQVIIRRSSDAGKRDRASRSQSEARAKRLEAQIQKLTAQLRRLKAMKKAGPTNRRHFSKSQKSQSKRMHRFSMGRRTTTRPSHKSHDRNEMRERMMKMWKARMGKKGAASSEMRERMMKMWKARMAHRKGSASKAGPIGGRGHAPSHRRTASGQHRVMMFGGRGPGKNVPHKSTRHHLRKSKVPSRKHAFFSKAEGFRRIYEWYKKLPKDKQDNLKRRIFAAAKAFKEAGHRGPKAFHHRGLQKDHRPSMRGHGNHGPSMRGQRGRRSFGHRRGMRGMWMRRAMRRHAMKRDFRGMQRHHGMQGKRCHGMRGHCMRAQGMQRRGMRRHGMRSRFGMRRFHGMRRGMQHHQGMRRRGPKGPSAKGKGGCSGGNCPMSKKGGMSKMKYRRHMRF